MVGDRVREIHDVPGGNAWAQAACWNRVMKDFALFSHEDVVAVVVVDDNVWAAPVEDSPTPRGN